MVKEEQFKFEVNEIAFSPNSDLFFLTNGQVIVDNLNVSCKLTNQRSNF